MAKTVNFQPGGGVNASNEAELAKVLNGRNLPADVKEQLSALYSKAIALEGMHDYESALWLVRNAMELENEGEKPHFYEGKLLYSLGQYEEASKSFERELEQSGGKSVEAIYFLGKTLCNLGRKKAGYEWLEKAYNADPSHPLSIAGKAQLLVNQNRGKEALRLVASVKGDDWATEVLEAKAYALFSCAKLEEADAAMKRIIEEKPNCENALCNHCYVLLLMGKPHAALMQAERAIAIAGEREKAPYMFKAVCLLGLNRRADALSAIKEGASNGLTPSQASELVEIAITSTALLGNKNTDWLLSQVANQLENIPGTGAITAATRGLLAMGRDPVKGMQLVENAIAACASEEEKENVLKIVKAKATIQRKKRKGDPALDLDGAILGLEKDDELAGSRKRTALKGRQKKKDASPAKKKDPEAEKQKAHEKACASLEECEAKIASLEADLESAKSSAEELDQAAKSMLPKLVREHGIKSASQARKAVSDASTLHYNAQEAYSTACAKYELCELAVNKYLSEAGILEPLRSELFRDSSLLLAHIRRNMKRGDQRSKLEERADWLPRSRMQKINAESEFKEAEEKLRIATTVLEPFLKIVDSRDEARNSIKGIESKLETAKNQRDALKAKIAESEPLPENSAL